MHFITVTDDSVTEKHMHYVERFYPYCLFLIGSTIFQSNETMNLGTCDSVGTI